LGPGRHKNTNLASHPTKQNFLILPSQVAESKKILNPEENKECPNVEVVAIKPQEPAQDLVVTKEPSAVSSVAPSNLAHFPASARVGFEISKPTKGDTTSFS